MNKFFSSLLLSATIVFVLASCNFSNNNQNQVIQTTPTAPAGVIIELTVQVNDTDIYDTVGQIITYYYNIKNTGTIPTSGSVTTIGTTLTCPAFNTIGNLDDFFDPNELLVCTAAYAITQTDLDLGSITNLATVTINGVSSNLVTTTLTTSSSSALKLTKTVMPETYDHMGQQIIYTYVITNSSPTALGPAQFIVSDMGMSAPINCGDPALILAPNATTTCSVNYTITQADMDASSVSTSATASAPGVAPSQPASATITKSTVGTNPPPSNLTPGSTISHKVVAGEWLWQIARCYGAEPIKVNAANSQLPDPAHISPDTTVTIPNIGSAGTIYGPPCVGTHTVQSGDTWNSVALLYNADITVLQMVNNNSITVGVTLKVPLNSAGGQ